jgi:hypothetical protein
MGGHEDICNLEEWGHGFAELLNLFASFQKSRGAV